MRKHNLNLMLAVRAAVQNPKRYKKPKKAKKAKDPAEVAASGPASPLPKKDAGKDAGSSGSARSAAGRKPKPKSKAAS